MCVLQVIGERREREREGENFPLREFVLCSKTKEFSSCVVLPVYVQELWKAEQN